MKNNSLPLTPEEYADRCWTYHDQYVDGVETDYIIVGKYIKKVVKRYKDMLNNKKYVFREDKVTKAFKFFSLLNIEHKNTYTQMFLLPWQCFFIACVFGFFYADDTNKRVFTEAFLFLSRKNGKTALAASIQLYGMVADGVANPQSILVANTSNQASVALNYAKDIVTHSPVLRSRLMGHRSRIIFADRQKQGFCQIFSTIDPARIEGFSPVFSIMDEVHNWENPGVYNALKTGTGARQNPLMMVITTAGSKTNGFCNDYLKMHKGILDGNIEGENTIGFI
jgi:phage terminase large subunit-like protein